VGDHQIEPLEPLEARADGAPRRIRVGDVALEDDPALVGRRRLRLPIDGDDPGRALLEQSPADRPTDALGRPGDDGRPTFETRCGNHDRVRVTSSCDDR
jgi:hypothetical protein